MPVAKGAVRQPHCKKKKKKPKQKIPKKPQPQKHSKE
jgi:hypothetical protein